ncbi:MAG: hypothetical protein WKF88_01600 [Ferruginibacter sp.]
MKSVKLFSLMAFVIVMASCETLQQATNTTGGAVFSLNGKWQLTSNSPENTLVNSIVTVTPLVSQGSITSLSNNTQCYRENDVKWKNIRSDKAGGYTLENLLSNCSSGALNYQAATIFVVNANEIRVSGQNAAGRDNTQSWTRIR